MKSKTRFMAMYSLFVALVLAFTCFSFASISTVTAQAETSSLTLSGDGSEANPYLITNLEELELFRDNVNGGNNYAGKHIKLTDNIDLSSIDNWTPIGYSGKSFNGVFNGNGFNISNLNINAESKSDIGFFGVTKDGEIKNFTIENAKIAGRLNVGVVAGTPYTTKYTDVKVCGHVEVNGMAYVGGVGGKNAYANWTNVTVDVDETSYVYANSIENGREYRTYVGGVVGFNGEGGHTFKNISSNVKVEGTVCDIGGIFGIAHYSNKFENVVFNGSVKAPENAEEVGGIAGVWHNQKGYSVTFDNCKSNGSVTIGNTTTTGSIVGGAYNATNETSQNSGSLKIDGNESWIKTCEINGVKYVSFSDAIANAKIGDEIILLDNIDEIYDLPAGVKLNANNFNAPNVTVEELLIEQVLTIRNNENNATIITITYLNSDEVTTFTIYDGKDGLNGKDGTNGLNGKDGINGTNGTNGKDGIDGVDGLGIKLIEISDSGELLITYTDNSKINLGVVVGANGLNGKDGINGINGKDSGAGLAITATVISGIALFLIFVLFICLFFKGAKKLNK